MHSCSTSVQEEENNLHAKEPGDPDQVHRQSDDKMHGAQSFSADLRQRKPEETDRKQDASDDEPALF
jgi:hypothetical protein